MKPAMTVVLIVLAALPMGAVVWFSASSRNVSSSESRVSDAPVSLSTVPFVASGGVLQHSPEDIIVAPSLPEPIDPIKDIEAAISSWVDEIPEPQRSIRLQRVALLRSNTAFSILSNYLREPDNRNLILLANERSDASAGREHTFLTEAWINISTVNPEARIDNVPSPEAIMDEIGSMHEVLESKRLKSALGVPDWIGEAIYLLTEGSIEAELGLKHPQQKGG